MNPKRVVLGAVAATLLHVSLARAQTRSATVDCAAFNRAIAASEMEMSDLEADGILDNSAPRASMRAQEAANELQKIQINITLMQQAHCPLPTTPVDPRAYLVNALACKNDRAKEPYNVNPPPSCDRLTWRRVGLAQPGGPPRTTTP